MTGCHYPEIIAWLPEPIFPLVGDVLVAAGAITTEVLTRCHFGLVVNGNKMRRVIIRRDGSAATQLARRDHELHGADCALSGRRPQPPQRVIRVMACPR